MPQHARLPALGRAGLEAAGEQLHRHLHFSLRRAYLGLASINLECFMYV